MPGYLASLFKAPSTASVVLLPLTFLFTGIICQEDLPPFENPRDILPAEVEGSYLFTETENSVVILLTVRNNDDETLEARASLSGTGTITLLKDTSTHRTFAWTVVTMAGSPRYNPTTKVLTLDPGEELQFVYSWDFIDDFGTDVRQSAFVYRPDAACSLREIAYQETFVLKSRIRIFEAFAEVTAPERDLLICHISTWVDPRVCSPVTPATACAVP